MSFVLVMRKLYVVSRQLVLVDRKKVVSGVIWLGYDSSFGKYCEEVLGNLIMWYYFRIESYL